MKPEKTNQPEQKTEPVATTPGSVRFISTVRRVTENPPPASTVLWTTELRG